MLEVDRFSLHAAQRRDRWARWVIVLGGIAIIASVAAILVLIAGTALPVFRAARASAPVRTWLPTSVASAEVIALGVQTAATDGVAIAEVLTRDGVFTFVDLISGKLVERTPLVSSTDEARGRLIHVEHHGGRRYTLLWSDGSVSLVEVTIDAEYDPAGRRTERCTAKTLVSIEPAGDSPTEMALLRQAESGTTTCVRLLANGQLVAARQVTAENLLGETETRTEAAVLDTDGLGAISALTMDRDGRTLYAGTQRGELGRWEFGEDGEVQDSERFAAFPDGRNITSLAMVFGDVSLAVGDSRGGLSTWFPVRVARKLRLRKIHTLTPHAAAVMQIHPTLRDKSLMSWAGNGAVHLDHMTSQRHLLALRGGESLQQAAFAPRGDAAVLLHRSGELVRWNIDRAYPEVSWGTLFGKVHYEGYEEPCYAWQTTGGDDFEPKLSLVPLISGTLKGTAHAMLLGVPLAIFAAIYASYFTTPAFRHAIKPVVEIMAALPSVVIGFLVALWLAPLLERWILAFFLSFITLPAAFLAFMLCWQRLRRFTWAKGLERGYEFLALLPVMLLGISLAVWASQPVESWLFDGDFGQFLYESLGLRYDQRNSIVIGIGLGFAVIPIIFSIAEDSLSSVPHALTASSLALGASRWQTLWHVVVPSASPGIFAGVIIGFGRAVGETMIVLMATGNTPILDWNPFTGMRTLSANIAVEIPEAPVGGALYRVLFLCAVLLFLLTFVLNTAAELVRQRLRQRYGRL